MIFLADTMSDQHLIADIPVKALIKKDDTFLIVEESGRGGWALPGGRLNEGEQPREGLQREILEELGVEIVIGNPVDCQVFTSPSGKKHCVIVFEATLADLTGEMPQPDPQEIKDAKWFTKEEALALPLRDEYRRILERLWK